MADCEVELGQRRYRVTFTDIGPAVGNAGAAGEPAGAAGAGVGGGRMKKEKKGKTRKAGRSGKVSGYMKFSQKIRPEILKQHPELKTDVIGVARKIGERWRALSQEEKNSYN